MRMKLSKNLELGKKTGMLYVALVAYCCSWARAHLCQRVSKDEFVVIGKVVGLTSATKDCLRVTQAQDEIDYDTFDVYKYVFITNSIAYILE